MPVASYVTQTGNACPACADSRYTTVNDTGAGDQLPSEALVKLPALRPMASRSPVAVDALPIPDAEASPVTLALVLRVPIPPALRSMDWMP